MRVTAPVNDREKIRQLPVQRAEFLELLYQTIKTRNAATLHTNKACRRGTVWINLRDSSVRVSVGERRYNDHRVQGRYDRIG